jgi:hypothetical protein
VDPAEAKGRHVPRGRSRRQAATKPSTATLLSKITVAFGAGRGGLPLAYFVEKLN